jgi:SAM-dependent methyltransferase
VTRLNDRDVVAREYATSRRLEQRRLDRTGYLRGFDEWEDALAAVAEVRPRRVLDAGCGAADFARVVAAPEVVCVDLAPAMVELARARGLDAREADIEDLPFADGEFDVVVSNWVLYHLPNLDRGVAELARVLRPGGRFVGIYNRRDHMSEVWAAAGYPWSPEELDCENGVEALARHFARVDRRDTTGEAVWLAREDLQAYFDAFHELIGEVTAPEGPYPFRTTRRNCVLVADKQ